MDEKLFSLISSVREGNSSAFSKLCEDFSPLMKSQVTRLFGDDRSEYDDRLQDAAMALYDAALTFDTAQDKVTFGLYAKICIRNRLVSVKRKENSKKKKSAPYLEGADTGYQETGRRASREKLEENMQVMSALSKYERAVLHLYLDGYSYRDIGTALKKSEKSVDNALYRIKSKLKKLI